MNTPGYVKARGSSGLRRIGQGNKLYFLLVVVVFFAGFIAGQSSRDVYSIAYSTVKPIVFGNSLGGNGVTSPAMGTGLESDIEDQNTPAEIEMENQADENQQQDGGTSLGDANVEQTSSQEKQQRMSLEENTGTKETQVQRKHELSKEYVEKTVFKDYPDPAKRPPVVVTWANYHYLDFVLNWVHHIQKTGCNTFIVGAMDNRLLEVLVEKNIPCFAMSSGLTTNDFGWGSSTFFKMGREKISLIKTFTHFGFDVLISDVDTAWVKNPIPYMEKYPEADILVSSDHLRPTTKDGGLEKWPDAGSAANIGIMLFRPKSIPLVDEWVAVLDKDPNYWDQNAFNDLFRRGMKILDREDRLFLGYDETIMMGILPVSTFCSGHTYFVQEWPARLGVDPYVVHATFQYSGTPGKRHRFREKNLWKDPETYFKNDHGFISSSYEVPESLLTQITTMNRTFKVDSMKPHFDLVNYQLSHVRALLGIATALNRTMIMPKLHCGSDRWWASHDGMIPGSEVKLPFVCPMDHVMDLEQMVKDMDVGTQGPRVDFKEYSFLEKPEAGYLQESRLKVIACDADSNICDDGSKEAAILDGNVIKLKSNMTDVQLKTALGSHVNKFSLLDFANPANLWFGFQHKSDADKFMARHKLSTSLWCCSEGHPGHVWYDLFWDAGPHTNRFGKFVQGNWTPSLGP